MSIIKTLVTSIIFRLLFSVVGVALIVFLIVR